MSREATSKDSSTEIEETCQLELGVVHERGPGVGVVAENLPVTVLRMAPDSDQESTRGVGHVAGLLLNRLFRSTHA
jgi:hypothetical protein